jgi:serralysin
MIEDGLTGRGNDTLIGNALANRLNGGSGAGRYTGNGGADTFVIGEKGYADTITDFKSGLDKLDLSAFHIGASKVSFSGNTVFADVDGNGTVDLAVISQADHILVSDIFFS